MTSDKTGLWNHLVEKHPEIAEYNVSRLVNLALDRPQFADQVFESVRKPLQESLEEESCEDDKIRKVTELAVEYPDQAEEILESVLLPAASNRRFQNRQAGYGGLGRLAGNESIDHRLLADNLINGVEDSYNHVNMAAAWSLTRVALVEPNAVARYWDRLAHRLATSEYDIEAEMQRFFGDTVDEEDEEQRLDVDTVDEEDETDSEGLLMSVFQKREPHARHHVVEALAASAIEKPPIQCPDDPLAEDNRGRAAAWAVYQLVNERGLPAHQTDLLKATNSTWKGHDLAGWIVDACIERIQTTDDQARPFVLLLGFIAPRNAYLERRLAEPELDSFREILKQSDEEYTPTDDSCACEECLHLKVEEPQGGHIIGNQASVPETVGEKLTFGGIGFDSEHVSPGDLISISVDGRASGIILGDWHAQEDTVRMGKSLRQKLGVTLGDEIHLENGLKAYTERVVLTVPNEFELKTTDFDDEFVLSAIQGQSLGAGADWSGEVIGTAPGDVLPVPVAVEPECVSDLAASLETPALLRLMPRIEETLDRRIVDFLPLCVISKTPTMAMQATPETELILRDEPFAHIGDWWHGLSPDETVKPTLVHELAADQDRAAGESSILSQLTEQAGLDTTNQNIPVDELQAWLAEPENRRRVTDLRVPSENSKR